MRTVHTIPTNRNLLSTKTLKTSWVFKFGKTWVNNKLN